MRVAEKIETSALKLLSRHFDVELGVDSTQEQLAEQIGGYDGILVLPRSGPPHGLADSTESFVRPRLAPQVVITAQHSASGSVQEPSYPRVE